MFGAFLADKGLGWRGTCWLLSTIVWRVQNDLLSTVLTTVCQTGLCTIFIILTLRETHL